MAMWHVIVSLVGGRQLLKSLAHLRFVGLQAASRHAFIRTSRPSFDWNMLERRTKYVVPLKVVESQCLPLILGLIICKEQEGGALQRGAVRLCIAGMK